MATIHPTESHSGCQTGPPCVRPRMALAVWLIGLLRENTCSHLGIDGTGTNTERANGSDRKRSTRPRDRSSARPTPVWVDPKITVCTKMPGIKKFTYLTPGGSAPLMAPPKT